VRALAVVPELVVASAARSGYRPDVIRRPNASIAAAGDFDDDRARRRPAILHGGAFGTGLVER